MPLLKDGLSFKPLLSSFTDVVFYHSVVVLLLTQCCAGQSQVVGPSQPIVASIGDDIILPCRLDPAADASDMTVEWSRPDLNPRFVHVWRYGVELESKKHPSYKGRTSLSINNLRHGDISLKLSKVKVSDDGKYRCFIPTLGRESTVELVVGVHSFIVVSLVRTEKDEVGSGLVLQCESKGWHPEPEVVWLDGEGNLLSAGPTETVRGPDDLYTVSSRVTVEKRHSNNFTCRVQQKDINQTRETHIYVPDDFFGAPCSCAAHITITLAVALLVILAIVLIVWKWRQNKIKIQTRDKEYVITTLVDHKIELGNFRDKLKSLLVELDRERSENKWKLDSVETRQVLSKYEVKHILLVAEKQLEKIKPALEECLNKAEEQLKTLEGMTAGNTQLKETERQRDKSQRNSEGQSSQREEGGENTELAMLTENHYTGS
ncbi:butyrophilin subfamily 3 member A2 [Dicentrarchus labrax]|uniref:Ig-like domain-containing protein n=1 Tax=Dicentrarchus labrax TaxID=13489 RepID=A0A8C4DSI3_DICLA|nr:butyrophilin subfamily 3 member A2 [Dicentrarchus labrax]XP_051251130.1 butyrophilin subfamily 3 member A2 [Dicentrarchus labrax]